MQQKKLENLRKDYQAKQLDISMVATHPIEQFKVWFNEAIEAMGSREPNAMTLATADRNGIPSARIVLLKGISKKGFVFYTNYESKKGQEMLENPNAALVFFWPLLERQVRIEGKTVKISHEDSEKYFQSRPKKSQIGAHASNQSSVIKSRQTLENKVNELIIKYETKKVLPRPENWGGYQLQPKKIEFWQGRSSRLHDRILYTQIPRNKWQIDRLSP